jgi:hypothetical protein
VTRRLPRLSHQVEEGKEEGAGKIVEQDGFTSNSAWEDEASDDSDDGDDDDEANAAQAVDRVLKKYEKAPVVDLNAQGSFDGRHGRSVKEKMGGWKRGYYRVWYFFLLYV